MQIALIHVDRCVDEAQQSDEAEATTENGTVLGVDLGVTQIAVTSTARFFDAGELNHYRREFENTRGGLQQTGTQSAHRTIETLSNREERYVKHVLHTVSNGIVEEAIEHGCDGIIFEDLTDIREDLPEAAWHSEWAFRKLKQFVEYKAEYEGLFIDTVNPRNTSKRCNECGFTHDSNRHRGEFECVSCGKSNHADYNAAKNVAELYLRRGHQPSGRRSVILIVVIIFVTTSRERLVRGLKPTNCDSPAVKTHNNQYQSIRSQVRGADAEVAGYTGSPAWVRGRVH